MQLLRAGVDPRKVTVIMNSVDLQLLKGVPQRATPLGGSSDDYFTLAYHGTLTHWYGVDLLLEAMAHLRDSLPQIRALVLGDGDALDSLRELALKRGLEDCVEFSGRYLSINDTLARVAHAQCGVIPNRSTTLNRYALSSKLFEYIALRIPVVVSRLETLSAHFHPDEVTFFEPDDALSLAEAITWVVEHPFEAAAKTRRASARAQEYSWERNRARYAAVLSES
jgi:glycosyltransferase involved in cell wall biosynthesis